MKLQRLPAWVVDDAESVKAEMAPYVGASVELLWRHSEACGRDAMWAVRASGMADRVLSTVDPLPESTLVALERLRREHRSK